MPELPEVRAQAGRLDALVAGHRFESFRALSFTAVKTAVPPVSDAVGRTVERVRSRGKLLVIDLGGVSFVVHLMQGGRLEPDAKRSAKPRGGLARLTFSDDVVLLFTEAGKEHKAGLWLVAGDPDASPPLDRLGPDADSVDVPELGRILHAGSGRLHTFLRDQHGVAGLGRRLANDVCHAAKLSPFANVKKLTDDEVAAIHAAIAGCVATALAYEATQSAMTKSASRPSRVHHRTGEPCEVCGDTIRAIEYRTHTVNYCPTCQTGGRVLADNTTSKFLK